MFRGALVTRMHGFLAIHYWSATISTFNLGCLMYQQNLLILKTISFLIQEYWINWAYGNAKPTRSLNTNSCVWDFFLAPTIWSDHRSLLHPVIARLQRPCNHSAIWWWHRWSCKWWWWSDVLLHACSRPNLYHGSGLPIKCIESARRRAIATDFNVSEDL